MTTDSAEEITDYRLTIRVDPDSVPRMIRLRRALKTIYRSFGVRCLTIDEVRPTPAPPPHADGAGGSGQH